MKILAWSSKSGSDAIWLTDYLEKINSKARVEGFVTNNPESPLIEYAQQKGLYICVLNKKPTLDEYLYRLQEWNRFSMHFLMGYLRIIPGEICEQVEMYNLHPANIIKHPFLKGFDPQKRALEQNLTETGVTLHKVSPIVDSGKIINTYTYPMKENETLTSLIQELVLLARVSWLEFIGEELEKFDDREEK